MSKPVTYTAALLACLLLAAPPARAQITVSLPDAVGQLDEVTTVALSVDTLTGHGVFAFNFTLTFDPDLVSVEGVEAAGTLSDGLTVAANTAVAGQVRVGVASSAPLSGVGTLLRLRLRGEGLGTSPLTLTEFFFNENTPASTPTNGQIQITRSGERDSDFDGAADVDEDDAFHNGDGNLDGIADRLQANVASFPSSTTGQPVTLAVEAPYVLFDVHATGLPSIFGAPSAEFPLGFVAFEIRGLPAGAGARATLYMPPGTDASTYWKYDARTNRWYEFFFNGQTGARFLGTRVELFLIDGFARGDHDGLANGTIVDPGAPAVVRRARGGSGGGQAPYAKTDRVETPEDVAVEFEVLENDSDPDGHDLEIERIASLPQHGTVQIVDERDGILRYVPGPDFNGEDTFRYEILDESGVSDKGRVYVRVLPVNDAPQAGEDAAETVAGAAVVVDVLANDSDVDGDALRVSAVGAPQHGTTVLDDGATPEDPSDDVVRYTPAAEFVGEDRFTYQVEDGRGGAAEGQVVVQVGLSDSLTAAGAVLEVRGVSPNPFNPVTRLHLAVRERAEVSVTVYDMLGRRVLALAPRVVEAGAVESVEIDGSRLPSGVYLYRVTARTDRHVHVEAGRMTLLK